MPVELNISADLDAAYKLFDKKNQKRVKRAAVRAINETAKRVKTRATDAIGDKLPLKRKAILRQIVVKRASLGSGEIVALVLSTSPARIPIVQLKTRPRQIKKGVRYKYNNKKYLVEGGFKAKVDSHTGFFKRKSNWKHKKQDSGIYHGLPIVELTVPGISSVFKNKEIEKAMLKHAGVIWPRSFARFVQFELSKVK
jgi:hypothetical protein